MEEQLPPAQVSLVRSFQRPVQVATLNVHASVPGHASSARDCMTQCELCGTAAPSHASSLEAGALVPVYTGQGLTTGVTNPSDVAACMSCVWGAHCCDGALRPGTAISPASWVAWPASQGCRAWLLRGCAGCLKLRRPASAELLGPQRAPGSLLASLPGRLGWLRMVGPVQGQRMTAWLDSWMPGRWLPASAAGWSPN